MVLRLLQEDYTVVVVDNLYNSSVKVLPRIAALADGKEPIFYEVDVCDASKARAARIAFFRRLLVTCTSLITLLFQLAEVFAAHDISAVIHFAALKAVGESMREPMRYYRNNVVGTLNLIEQMQAHNCQTLVFSSSCTVYGQV